MISLVRASVAAAEERWVDDAVEREVMALFDCLHGGLLRYAGSFGLSVQDAEDVVQEAFLALFDHLVRGRSRSNLEGWMFRVTHNRALTRRRSRVREGVLLQVEAWPDPHGSPEEQLLFGEMQLRVQSVFRALPERDRWCLQLRAEGLRYREIARIVGVSLGWVAGSLAGSMRRLAGSGGER